MKTYIFWLSLLCGVVSAWLSTPLPLERVSTNKDLIFERQDGESEAAGCAAVCKSSGCGGCNGRSKRSLAWQAESSVSSANITRDALQKRVLEGVSADDVGNYVDGLANGGNVISIVATTAERYLSFSVQRRFEDYPDTNSPLIIGVRGGFLTGCTVLTVVSARAVWMAHFYQDLAFSLEDPEEDDPEPDFQRNVVNLITGAGNLYYADGPGIDPALFTGQDDEPYAALMVPRHNNRGRTEYYISRNRQIEALIGGLIPGCRFDKYKYFAESGYPDEPERGVAVFEYDADADGNGNGDWRLWYESKVARGRLLGQNVIPSAG